MGCGVSLRRRERGMAALLIFDLWPVDTYVWWLATLWDPHLRGLSRSVLSIRPLAVREPDWDVPLNSEAIKAILAFQIVDVLFPSEHCTCIPTSPLQAAAETTYLSLEDTFTCFCSGGTGTWKKRGRRSPRLTHLGGAGGC